MPAISAADQVLQEGDCVPTAMIESIELTGDGLFLRSDVPLDVAITEAAGLGGTAVAAFGSVTVEVRGAGLAAMPVLTQSDSGPFSAMRISRFRQVSDCGIRIRLQAREVLPWVIEHLEDGSVLIGPRILPVSPSTQPDVVTGLAGGGSVDLSGDFGLSGASGQGIRDSYRLTVGFSQALPRGALLRGFFGGVNEPEIEGSPFGAVEVSDLRFGDTAATVAAGDLMVGLGSTGRSRFFSGVLIRGGAVALRRGAAMIEAFGGQAARSTLFRIPGGGGVISELGDDRVFGTQLLWELTESTSLGGGWVTSLPSNAPRRNNLFQSLEIDRDVWDLRLMLEESLLRSGSDLGYAFTVDPSVQTQRFSLSGFYRYRSADFEPALASGYFAALRRSYGLSASWRPLDQFSLYGSAGQSKSFSILDPLDQGTLTSSHSLGARWQVRPAVAITANHYETDRVSDRDVFLAADSSSVRSSLGTSFRFGEATAGVRVARQHVRSEHQSRTTDFLEGDLSAPIGKRGHAYGRLTLGDPWRSEKEREIGIAIGARAPAGTLGTLRGDVRYSEVPAGIFFQPARQLSFQLGASGGAIERILRGSLNLHYTIAERADDRHSAWGMFVSFGHLVDWGAESRPEAPFATRAIPVEPPDPLQMVIVAVRAFLDVDHDGIADSGEPPLEGIRFRADGRTIATGPSGVGEIALASLPEFVTLQRDAAVADLFTASERQHPILTGGRAVLEFAFRPAGRLNGAVRFQGTVFRPDWLVGIRVSLEGEGIRRETVTGAAGEFSFGVLPAGVYSVSVDVESLAEETRPSNGESVETEVFPGEAAAVVFGIRAATARERFGIPQSGSPP